MKSIHIIVYKTIYIILNYTNTTHKIICSSIFSPIPQFPTFCSHAMAWGQAMAPKQALKLAMSKRSWPSPFSSRADDSTWSKATR